jgi:transcription elongation GreA/GreB family factor
MMTPDAMAQLLERGNAGAVEEEMMRLAASPDAPVASLARFARVFEQLARTGKTAAAEELAWGVIEAVIARASPAEALKVAGPFLLAVGESETLRSQVAELYRKAFADIDGFEALLAEAGLAGGRPVRRALRTLDVCLAIRDGDYLVARDEDDAARIDSVDRSNWRITISDSDGEETYGPVHLADRYRPARADEFRVLRHFAKEQLDRKLQQDPASIVIDICREHGGLLDSVALEAQLVPALLSAGEWKKWWPKARTALKRCPNIRLEGRSPYTIEYVDKPISLDEGVFEEFRVERDPLTQVEVVEAYVRECRSSAEQPSAELLQQCITVLVQRADRSGRGPTPEALRNWCCVRKTALLAGAAEGKDQIEELLRAAPDPTALITAIQSDGLQSIALEALAAARPADFKRHYFQLLPVLSLSLCEACAQRMIDSSEPAEFEPVVQRIMAEGVPCFEALLWMWDGPAHADRLPLPPAINVLMRVLRSLEDARLHDHVDRETTKRVCARARAVLAARSFERFDACLVTIDASMAAALRTQLRQQDALGRAVREDLLQRLDRKFPPISKHKEVPSWAREDVLFVTEQGMTRKHAEIDHHVHVKMRENAIAIGRAAEHGDLSENSEYKFALEERDLLQARLAQMNAELSTARILTPAEVSTERIGVGTRAVFQRTGDGVRYELTFVGPWEADGEKGLINYKAPLAQKLMGKRIGDLVEFEHTGASGQYELVALHNGLDHSSS